MTSENEMADGGAEARAGLSALINCQAMPKQQQRQQQQLRDNCNGDNVAANAAIAVAIAIAAVWPLHRVAVAFAKLQPEGGRGRYASSAGSGSSTAFVAFIYATNVLQSTQNQNFVVF